MSRATGGSRDLQYRVAGLRQDGTVMNSMVYAKGEVDIILDAWKSNDYFKDAWLQKNDGGWHNV